MDVTPSPDYSPDDPAPYDCQAWPIQTPGSLPTQVNSRRLFIPDAVDWKAIVNGALWALTQPEYYRENEIAGITPVEAARRAFDMFWDYADSEGWMIGTIVPYMTNKKPPYTLDCDGTTYNRVDYPELYAKLADAFIVDADTFIVPDLRQNVIVGAAGVSGFNPGEVGGEAEHTLSIAEMPAHAHTDAGHTHTEGIALPSATVEAIGVPFPSAVPGAGVTGAGFASIQPTGGDLPHNNMQPYVALNFAVYYR